jgi:hypothetical protein
MTKPLLSLLALTLGFAAAQAAAQTCYVADPVWQAGHAQASGTLSARVTLLGTNLTGERSMTLEMLLGAIKVYTKQVSVSGDRVQTAARSSQEAHASAVTEQDRRDAIVKAKETYSYETGQGVNACQTIETMKEAVESLGSTTQTAKTQFRALDVAPGKATPIAEAVRTRLDNAKKTDSATLLDPAASDEDKRIVIQHLAGLPMPVPSPAMSGAEKDVAMLRARRVEALRSPALASLTAVAAMSSKKGHFDEDDTQAPVQWLDTLVEQYGGGSKHEAWSNALAGQSERGLMMELSRLRAMSLRVRQLKAEQSARLTALFATMVGLEAGGPL